MVDASKPHVGIELSVVIPVANQDNCERLIQDLQKELSKLQISHEIFVAIPPDYLAPIPSENVKLVSAQKKSRATQMNHAAALATGKLLWFLHADSQIQDCDLHDVIPRALNEAQPTCWYFQLSFESSSSSLCRLNAYGANYRSRKWNLPFGDQGFLLKNETFETYGPFPETFYSGEDHAFIQNLKQNNVQIKCTNKKLITSPRKYQKRGWLQTTLTHLFLTVLQEYKFKSNA